MAEALESILAQAYQPLQVLVIDDGSADQSAVVARGFSRWSTACNCLTRVWPQCLIMVFAGLKEK